MFEPRRLSNNLQVGCRVPGGVQTPTHKWFDPLETIK